MGGFGSGRTYGRPLAESCLRIDIAWMTRKGFAVPGSSRIGKLQWVQGDRPAGDVAYTCNMFDPHDAWLELRFKIPVRAKGGYKHFTQRIRLSFTVPRYGGRRWWMHCPINGARVGKLYVPPGGDIFASRKAWRIGYRSQRGTARDRVFEKLFRLQRRLGGPEGWGQGIMRPKGMHHATFERHFERFLEIDAQCVRQELLFLRALESRFPFDI